MQFTRIKSNITSLLVISLLTACNTTAQPDSTSTSITEQSQLNDEENLFADGLVNKVPMYMNILTLNFLKQGYEDTPGYIEYIQCVDNIDLSRAKADVIDVIKEAVSESDYNEVIGFFNNPIVQQNVNYQLQQDTISRTHVASIILPKPDIQEFELFMQNFDEKYLEQQGEQMSNAWERSSAYSDYEKHVVNEYSKCSGYLK